jgi:hypothetical protein
MTIQRMNGKCKAISFWKHMSEIVNFAFYAHVRVQGNFFLRFFFQKKSVGNVAPMTT